MKRTIKIIFLAVVVIGSVYYWNTLKGIWEQSFNHYFPCKQPIYYSIGAFDTQFGISKDDFLKALASAETIWEKPLGKNLFQYSSDGELKINLIYDVRQQATSELKNVGAVVDNGKASYDSLKSQYDSLVAEHNKDEAAFESAVKALDARKKAYDQSLAMVGTRGVSRNTLESLRTEAQNINNDSAALNQQQNNLNAEVKNINALTSTINQLATNLNKDVNKFNTIDDTLPGEFDEGLYKSGPDGQEIDIYQYDNQTKLVRVLAHELGHALGLDHVDDPKAIMYRLNNGINEKLTSADLAEIDTKCGIK